MAKHRGPHGRTSAKPSGSRAERSAAKNKHASAQEAVRSVAKREATSLHENLERASARVSKASRKKARKARPALSRQTRSPSPMDTDWDMYDAPSSPSPTSSDSTLSDTSSEWLDHQLPDASYSDDEGKTAARARPSIELITPTAPLSSDPEQAKVLPASGRKIAQLKSRSKVESTKSSTSESLNPTAPPSDSGPATTTTATTEVSVAPSMSSAVAPPIPAVPASKGSGKSAPTAPPTSAAPAAPAAPATSANGHVGIDENSPFFKIRFFKILEALCEAANLEKRIAVAIAANDKGKFRKLWRKLPKKLNEVNTVEGELGAVGLRPGLFNQWVARSGYEEKGRSYVSRMLDTPLKQPDIKSVLGDTNGLAYEGDFDEDEDEDEDGSTGDDQDGDDDEDDGDENEGDENEGDENAENEDAENEDAENEDAENEDAENEDDEDADDEDDVADDSDADVGDEVADTQRSTKDDAELLALE